IAVSPDPRRHALAPQPGPELLEGPELGGGGLLALPAHEGARGPGGVAARLGGLLVAEAAPLEDIPVRANPKGVPQIVPATGGPHVEGPGVAPVLHAGRVRLARQVLPRPVIVQHDPVLARGLSGTGVLGPPQRCASDQLHAASTASA